MLWWWLPERRWRKGVEGGGGGGGGGQEGQGGGALRVGHTDNNYDPSARCASEGVALWQQQQEEDGGNVENLLCRHTRIEPRSYHFLK